MDNLWKKETTQNQTGYIDLFASLQEDDVWNDGATNPLETITFRKDNEKSLESRTRGNEIFAAKNWEDAMEHYNQSLRNAEVGSENVALAYSNRSACFFYMQMYDEALVDIELAKKENLPYRLLPKLQERRQKCLELANTVQRMPEYQPKLDYEPNKQFPCLANLVKIEQNDEFGRYLVANSDIPKGKTILLEEHFAVSHIEDFSICYTCYRATFSNYLACEHCTNVMFCSVECKNRNKTHEWECGTFFGMRFFNDVKIQKFLHRTRLIVQTILTAVTTFPNVETLMQFVENTLREDPDKLPTSMHDNVSKYHFFFKLKKRMVNPLDGVKRVYQWIMLLPKIRALFDNVEKQHFLMHLIAHHSLIVDTNSIGSKESSNVNIVFSMFNHCCEPNVKESSSEKITYCTTSRPVKKGEQLFISYLSPDEMKLPKEKRQEKLRNAWGFVCKCKKCV
ncbi:SET and MYND domain-containing protein 4-like [Sitodiplosis mosellana]|uniref:SET and MYND domain-containing protein 4-like n=1 Tax=Sitodiplosis mosellana TaxID=263140 RepID=UPI002443E4AB|nr:SET and MYND domain-containing protein 4-like [Sitodiplosis mosellana]XP_055326478.1 SET and MYND domain-containing protein 4-like [Sitodiplosis mosellana]XP_055326479.1 SET and MYND domain-containing protein 4-like [Sitodiplosis mosellana]